LWEGIWLWYVGCLLFFRRVYAMNDAPPLALPSRSSGNAAFGSASSHATQYCNCRLGYEVYYSEGQNLSGECFVPHVFQLIGTTVAIILAALVF